MTATAVPRSPRRRAALGGALAAGFALATGELVSAVAGISPSPLLAVGGRFVDRFAASLKDLAVAIFGTNDKAALVAGTVVIAVSVAALTGAAALERRWLPTFVVGAFGTFGVWAQAADPQVGAGAAIAIGACTVAAGASAMTWLVGLARGADVAGEPARAEPMPSPRRSSIVGDAPRRHFLVSSAGIAAATAVFVAVGRSLASGDVVAAARAIPLPRPRRRRRLPDTTAFDGVGVTPYVTSNDDFYRIDTALIAPRVDVTDWRLRVGGMVDRPFSLDYEELLAMDSVEEPVTLQCVSNEVGGDLVGNAVWQGVPLASLLERAGVGDGAEQVFSRSADGWTCGFPTTAIDGDRVALVAYAMNGRRLPVEHGFPARLVVSGLYGYVSATKWLTSIELTTWDGADGYWVPRGWSKRGPAKLASRIDVPRPGATVPAGPLTMGGVAWLPSVGVSAVEVSIDDGEWRPCELGRVASEHTWVQWRHRWNATPGRHEVAVRAVDAAGDVQTSSYAPPAPDGASGHHRTTFEVVG